MALFLWCAFPVLSRPVPPRAQLETAIDTYEHGGYLEAAAQLNKLLYPLKLSSHEDIVRAKVYLGLCYYILDKKEEAEQEFRGVFKLDPNYRPDPLFVPPEVIAFIERFRPPPPLPPRRTDVLGLGETLDAPGGAPFRFQARNMLPFGIPQFGHGDMGKGLALLAGEVSLLALNVGSYAYLKVYNDPGGVPAERYPYLLVAKATNITTLSLLAISVIYGMGDALYRYQPESPAVTLRLDVEGGDYPRLVLILQRRF